MVKNNVYKFLIIALVVSLSLNVALVVLSVVPKGDLRSEVNFSDANFDKADFPLEIDLPTTVFNVGDRVSGTATITNKSGRTVEVISNGYMPCVYLHNANTTIEHGHLDSIYFEVLKPGDKMTTVFSREVTEAGTYILETHYEIRINRHVEFYSELENIIIEVK
ncbi:MAG: hypothetical protein LBC03_05625 [Nitrososphaerota archaeon]|jgi:hypothetical protein|nr:hypothetical protein [Nitrososphaerota archaeon]